MSKYLNLSGSYTSTTMWMLDGQTWNCDFLSCFFNSSTINFLGGAKNEIWSRFRWMRSSGNKVYTVKYSLVSLVCFACFRTLCFIARVFQWAFEDSFLVPASISTGMQWHLKMGKGGVCVRGVGDFQKKWGLHKKRGLLLEEEILEGFHTMIQFLPASDQL